MSLAIVTTERFASPEHRRIAIFRARCEAQLSRFRRDIISSECDGLMIRFDFRSREAGVCAKALLLDAGLLDRVALQERPTARHHNQWSVYGAIAAPADVQIAAE